MSTYKNIVSKFKNKRILVLGDLILDQHIQGSVSRISPEAPVPVVLQEGRPKYAPGGAANVAGNLRSLGAKVILIGCIGKDREGTIFLEDLNVNKMLEKSHGNLSRQISDMSWGILINMLKYKGNLYGRHIFEVNPKNTSKMCSTCRNIKEELKLSEREWQCKHCHSHHDRDFNASMNVLKLGQELPEYKALKASA